MKQIGYFLLFVVCGLFVGSSLYSQEDEVVIAPVPKLRIVVSDSCPPCVELKKWIKDKDCKELLKKFDFELLDYYKSSEFVKKHRIKAVPTIVLIKDGKVVYNKAGRPKDKKEFIKLLESWLK